MAATPENSLLRVSEEEKIKIREEFNLDEKKVNENLDVIEEWCEKQEHLKEALQYFDRKLLEYIHILARGSIEATKTKIDKILTTRGLLSELTLNMSIDEFENFSENMFKVIMKVEGLNIKWIILITSIGDQRSRHDYSICDRHILDFKNMNINIVSKINPITLKKVQVLGTETYGLRIKGIHFVNTPPLAAKLSNLLKLIFKDKISRRIHVHASYEELHKEIPKEVLPGDYGGDGPNCAQIAEQWKEYLKTDKARKIMEISNKMKSDESKRSSIKFNEEYLGMSGTFRSLNVD
ncbi:retinaldehyde-binding protein 1-like [Melitaea cinxia]|uniref:retinaldehyde-binding protein 1-like n=1 Tax=Melitaea cinxia TaxID=113334 RepID=UPI001E26E903|nr:retinaldehyde-binding protein 1-like [Melitaea cinxia]